MVLLHVKRAEDQQFLFETTVTATVRDTTKEVCTLNNLRHRIQRLKTEAEQLAQYGPAKHPDKQGLDEYQAR